MEFCQNNLKYKMYLVIYNIYSTFFTISFGFAFFSVFDLIQHFTLTLDELFLVIT